MVRPLKNHRTNQIIMQTNHTPGPYKAVKGTEDEPDRWIIVADNGTQPYHIATVENGQPGDSLDTEEATAIMLAASHEALEALQVLLGCIIMGGDPYETNPQGVSPVGAAKAAVSKSCGQNSSNTTETPANESALVPRFPKLWFAYDPGDGFEEYATEAEARAAAEKALGYYRDAAPDEGWSDEVTDVCYGKITGWTVETMRKSKPPAEELDEDGMDEDDTYWGEWDVVCDYGLHSEDVITEARR
jgi:hypothetical protein